MGCAGSRFDSLPVVGHSSGFGVLQVNGEHCMRPEKTVLKLREKLLSFSGDDCSIKVSISETQNQNSMTILSDKMPCTVSFVNYFPRLPLVYLPCCLLIAARASQGNLSKNCQQNLLYI